jgi:hypothetical protein
MYQSLRRLTVGRFLTLSILLTLHDVGVNNNIWSEPDNCLAVKNEKPYNIYYRAEAEI